VTAGTLPGLVDELADRHAVFASLRERNGVPPAWRRTASFATLTLFVLEQQVSLASARAAYLRLVGSIGDVTPDRFLRLDDGELRAVGFSRQKAGYTRGLARLVIARELDLEALALHDDATAAHALLSVRGIGPWTAACFLLFALGRPDAWPTGDRALYVSMRNVMDLGAVPTAAEADGLAAEWAPLRAVAARMLWHEYLGGRSWEPTPALPGVG
jgi:DNA-3-methyladenine glycosylase II